MVEREVDAKLLLEGDLVKVPPGAKIPAGGIVEFGTSEVDESALTGGSVPVSKKQGDKVVGATLNHGWHHKGKAVWRWREISCGTDR